MSQQTNIESERAYFPLPEIRPLFFEGKKSWLFRTVKWRIVGEAYWRDKVRPFVTLGTSLDDVIAMSVYSGVVIVVNNRFYRASKY